MSYKAFILDIDGTICDYDGLLSLEAAHSIRWMRKLGYEVVLASGRGPWDTYYLGVYLGCTKMAVCENGGILMTSPTDMKLYTDKSKSLEAYDFLSKKFEDVRLKPVGARLTEVVLLRTFDSAKGQKSLDDEGIPVTIHDSKFALHLDRKGIDKSVALSEGLRYLGIDPKDAIAIGDSSTDIPMFELCGFSFALGNASDDLRSRAKHVCSSEIGDGTVEAISYAVENLLR